MSLYYCRRILYFVTDLDTFVVTDVLTDVTAEPVEMYVDHVSCAVMTPLCMSTFGLHTVMGSTIRVHTIVVTNKPSHTAVT